MTPSPSPIPTPQTPLIPYVDMGVGFLIGLSIGYVLKKSFKILLFILGLSMIGLFVLESKGMMTLNESSIESTVGHMSGLFQDFGIFLKNRLETFQFSKGASAIAGFLLGLKIG